MGWICLWNVYRNALGAGAGNFCIEGNLRVQLWVTIPSRPLLFSTECSGMSLAFFSLSLSVCACIMQKQCFFYSLFIFLMLWAALGAPIQGKKAKYVAAAVGSWRKGKRSKKLSSMMLNFLVTDRKKAPIHKEHLGIQPQPKWGPTEHIYHMHTLYFLSSTEDRTLTSSQYFDAEPSLLEFNWVQLPCSLNHTTDNVT